MKTLRIYISGTARIPIIPCAIHSKDLSIYILRKGAGGVHRKMGGVSFVQYLTMI